MTPTDTDYKTASAELAKLLANERKINGILREQLDDLAAFVSKMFDTDRDHLLANASVTYRDDDGTHLTIADLVAMRDRYRNVMAHLEAENAALIVIVESVKLYARELIGQWTGDHIGNDLLAILTGETKGDAE